jgi:hypothetical protein
VARPTVLLGRAERSSPEAAQRRAAGAGLDREGADRAIIKCAAEARRCRTRSGLEVCSCVDTILPVRRWMSCDTLCTSPRRNSCRDGSPPANLTSGRTNSPRQYPEFGQSEFRGGRPQSEKRSVLPKVGRGSRPLGSVGSIVDPSLCSFARRSLECEVSSQAGGSVADCHDAGFSTTPCGTTPWVA